jgi:hypothetical protein
MKKAFSKIAIAPGGEKLIAAGNSNNITADFSELDKRIGKHMKKFLRFPEGMMSIAFSQSEQKRVEENIESALSKAKSNTDARPSLPFLYLGYRSRLLSGDIENPGILVKTLEGLYERWILIAIVIAGIYLGARFFLSRKMSVRLNFASFENGFYAMGAELLLLFAYQTVCGSLYRDLAAALGIFIGGAALGAWGAEKSKAFAMLATAGGSVGAAYSEFTKRSGTKSGARLWSSEMLGGAMGIVFIILFLLPSGGCLPAAILLAFLRAPLILYAKK